jgi:hypothetical protein
MSSVSNLPNYVTPTTKASWDYDVLHYYNQYCATEKETQNRRVARNYAMYQADLKKQNQSMIQTKNGIRTYFFYTYLYSYMVHEYPEVNGLRKNVVYLRLPNQNCWCLQRTILLKENQCLFDFLSRNKFNYLLSLYKR